MAEPVWISQNGNWGATASWSTGVVPISGDSVIFDGRSVVSVTKGLDQSGVGAFTQLTVKKGYTGNIGCPGDPLKIEIDSVAAGVSNNATFAGPGVTHVEFAVGGVSDVVVDGGSVFIGEGSVRNLFCRGGFTQVAAKANILARVAVLGVSAQLDILAAATTEAGPTLMVCTNGTTNNDRAQSGANAIYIVSGGKFNQTQILEATTSVHVLFPGSFKYVPKTAPATAPNLFAWAGVTDLGQSPFDFDFTDLIIGPQAGVQGTPHSGGTPSGLTVTIDLREEFP